MEKKKYIKIATALFAFFLFFSIPFLAGAATLEFSPPTISRAVGETFSVSVFVSSADKSANAVSGVVSFPKDKIQVSSVSKSNSVVNFWVEEPTFSNSEGKVNFEGVVLNPGYKGAKGNIITIVFKAKATGSASVSFSSGSVLANDGLGTNILQNLGTASFIISEAGSKVPASSAKGIKKSSIITSTTHPDEAKWYSNSSPEFSWGLNADALEVKTAIGKSPEVLPSVSYIPPISSKKVENLQDGTYYFSLQIRTKKGWGNVERFRVNIDTTPPNPFSVTFPHGAKGFEPQPVLLFNTTDDLSGVSHYDVKVGDGGPEKFEPLAVSNPHPLTPQYPGDYVVTVTAVDEAGNKTSALADFTIEAIEAPTITRYEEEISYGDLIKIRGATYQNSEITVYIKQDGKIISEEYTRSNAYGDFNVVIGKRLYPGIYIFTARVTDTRGARSNETVPLTFVVKSAFLAELVNLILNYLSAAILILLALAGILGSGFYLWRRLLKVLRRLRSEAGEAEHIMKKSFSILRKDISQHITKLEAQKPRTKLSKEEKEEIAFLKNFGEDLDEAENIITKEIEDVSHDAV